MTSPIQSKPLLQEKNESNTGFLVLTRRSGERIIVGHGSELIITYLGRDFKDAIKIGIQAPKEIPVWREEVYLRIQEQDRTETDTPSEN